MVWYIAKKAVNTLKKITGLWQHTRSTSPNTVEDVDSDIVAVGDEAGTVQLKLSGRDVAPRKRSANSDHSDELEVSGFLDQFEPHPLMVPAIKSEAGKKQGSKSSGE